MYLHNKYTKWYYNIIETAKANPFDGYTEKHHIIPKSLGGSNKKENLVVLSARQHFIAHWLLTKMVDGKNKHKMVFALNCMMGATTKSQNRYIPSSIIYEKIRSSLDMSGPNHPTYGRKIPKDEIARRVKNYNYTFTQEHKDKLSAMRIGKSYEELMGEEKAKAAREKMSKARKGVKRPYINDRMKEVAAERNATVVTCEHCGKDCNPTDYGKDHGKYCKENPDRIVRPKVECEVCGRDFPKNIYAAFHGPKCSKGRSIDQ